MAKANYDQKNGKILADTALATLSTFRQMMLLKTDVQDYLNTIKKNENKRLPIYMEFYSNCNGDLIENSGHNFGTGLSDEEKKFLKAFMATL